MSQNPIFTVITPTVGRKSIYKLKKILQKETIPYVHLILWDSKRCEDAVRPCDLEDDVTYCYEFHHPLYARQNARNDVWLRAVGISLARTPYITFSDDDTWPEENHLHRVYKYMIENKLDYTHCIRRMWSPNCEAIGEDRFEAIGELNSFGYTLLDNSSLFLNSKAALIVMQVFLQNQVYGDDRVTHGPLKKYCSGKRIDQVLKNHTCQPNLEAFFRKFCTPSN